MFDEIIDRRGTNCVKWDECETTDMLPLWVADMDFRVAQPIAQALRKRMEHEVFGYVCVPDSYYDAVIGWFQRRHGWTMKREWIIYTSGVVPAISAIIKAMAKPGEKVLVMTPVYNCFFSSIRNNGCMADEVPLTRKGDSYVIDFEELELHAADPATTVLLLCNPHNPAGRVWTREELQRIGDICLRHGVFVVADEIHCELVMPGHRYTPYASLGGDYQLHSATCTSASKAFNIAGLQIANITVEEPQVRQRIDRAININEVCDVNPFGIVALQAAYNECEPWLEQLNAYLYDNYLFAKEFIEQHLPMLKVTRLEGTYLLWLDVSAMLSGSSAPVSGAQSLCDVLKKEARLWFAAGTTYGAAGEGFVRINLACPRATLSEALHRLHNYVSSRQSH